MLRKFAVFLAVALLSPASPAGSADTQAGWRLEQNAKLVGDYTIWVTPTALKAYCKGTKSYLLIKAPEWNVNIYSTQHKLLFSTPLSKWKGITGGVQGVAEVAGEQWDDFAWKKGEKTTFRGIVGVPYDFVGLKPGKRIETFKVRSARYIISEQIKADAKICFVLERLYHLPHFGAVPLALIFMRKKGGNDHVQVETLKVVKENMTRDIFTVPPGLKVVKRETEVVEGGDSNEWLKEFSSF